MISSTGLGRLILFFRLILRVCGDGEGGQWSLDPSLSLSCALNIIHPFVCSVEDGWWCVLCVLTAVALTIDLLRSLFFFWTVGLALVVHIWAESCSPLFSLESNNDVFFKPFFLSFFSLSRRVEGTRRGKKKINWCSIVRRTIPRSHPNSSILFALWEMLTCESNSTASRVQQVQNERKKKKSLRCYPKTTRPSRSLFLES